MDFVYLIAGVAALTWGAVYALRGSLVAGCLALLVIAACFGHDFANFHLGPVALTLDRIMLVLLGVAYVVQHRLGRTEPKRLGRVDLLLLAFLGVLVASGCYGGWAGNQSGQGGDGEPLFRLIVGYMIPFGVYWIARQSPLRRANVSCVYIALTALGVYLAVTALLEITGQWWAVFPKHIADPNVGRHFGRARGPMVHSVHFGMCLSVCLLAAWTWRRQLGRVGQLAIIALVPLMLAAIYFSYTRSVWMGAGLAVMVVLGLTLRGVWRPLVLGSMVSAAVLLAATRMDELKSFQREYSAAETGSSVDLRSSFAYISWKMFLDRPLCGVGFGQFPQAKLPYLSDRSTSLRLEETRRFVHHNGFLSVLTETGLIGMTLYLAVLIAWGRSAWQLLRDTDLPDWMRSQGILMLAVLATYICQAAFHELSYSSIENGLLFFMAGITTGLRGATQPAANAAGAAAVKMPAIGLRRAGAT